MPSMEIDCIRVLMFDLFGTCFDASSAGKAGILSYSEQIRPWRAWQEFADKNGGDAIACRTALPLWQPLNLPLTWASLPPFPDVSVAMPLLRNRFTCVTMTNFPLHLQVRMCRNAQLQFDCIFPLELCEGYKPCLFVYEDACRHLDVAPESCLMVTSNKDFGDLEAARRVGMQSILVDRYGKGDGTGPATFTDLAAILEAL
jgi:HAD superfamily hydrolase (TIGR01493 family)